MTGFHWKTVTTLLVMMATLISAIPDMDCPATDEDIVLYPNPEDCATFYQCSYGRPVLHKCPPGLHYNAQKQYCDYPASAGCQTFLKYSVPNYECPANDDGGPLILYADPDDCTKYYACDNGASVSMWCSPGLHFNDILKVCDHQNAAGCKATPSFYSSLSAFPGFECPITDDGDNITFYPNPKDCNEYYACDNGVLTVLKCPPNLHFNPTLNVCDWPNNVNCKATPSFYSSLFKFGGFDDHTDSEQYTTETTWTETTDEPVYSTTKLPGFVCPDVDDGGNIILYPDPENCEKYYACDNGVETSMDCPPGLHFNPILSVCDHPNVAGCKVSFGRREQQIALLMYMRRAH